jgi:hypothetical protein
MPIELPKLPIFAESPPSALERDSLPFCSVPLSHEPGGARAGTLIGARGAGDAAAAQQMQNFVDYLNRRNILKLSRYRGKTFDAAAEILGRSVYKPIKIKSGK